MKIFYVANIRFPSERAHGIQVAHMCHAFAAAGAAVTLLVPDRKTLSDDPFAYYGIVRNFTIEKVPVPDTVRFGTFGFLIEALIFAWRAAKKTEGGKGGEREENVIYTREELPLLFLPRGNAFYEAHQLRRSALLQRAIRRAKGVIALTHGLKDALASCGIPKSRITVAHDGYDETAFAARLPKAAARQALSLPQDKKMAMYIGGLEPWKGAPILFEAAQSLAKDGIAVALIGGTPREIAHVRARYPEALFLGPKPYRDLPLHQQAGDILVIPNSLKSASGSIFTSPLKLFAHMASGVPIAAADVPALREVVGPAEAFIFPPDDAPALARVLRDALSSEGAEQRVSKSAAAAAKVRKFTWTRRAEKIMEFLRT